MNKADYSEGFWRGIDQVCAAFQYKVMRPHQGKGPQGLVVLGTPMEGRGWGLGTRSARLLQEQGLPGSSSPHYRGQPASLQPRAPHAELGRSPSQAKSCPVA